MNPLAYLIQGTPPETQELLGAFGVAGFVLTLIAGVWAIFLKLQKKKKPYPYTFLVIAGMGIATIIMVVILSAILPPSTME